MKEKILPLVLVGMVMFSCQPQECKELDIPFYDFAIPVQITPAKNQFDVGDTLKVAVRFDSKEVYEIHSESRYDLSKFEIFPSGWFPQVDTFPVVDGFQNNQVIVRADFNPRIVEHSTITATLNLDLLKVCDQRIAEYELVLNHPGVYCLLNCPIVFDDTQDFPGKCHPNHSQTHTEKVIPFSERKDLIALCQDNYIKQILEKDFETCAGFCFEVK